MLCKAPLSECQVGPLMLLDEVASLPHRITPRRPSLTRINQSRSVLCLLLHFSGPETANSSGAIAMPLHAPGSQPWKAVCRTTPAPLCSLRPGLTSSHPSGAPTEDSPNGLSPHLPAPRLPPLPARAVRESAGCGERQSGACSLGSELSGSQRSAVRHKMHASRMGSTSLPRH